MRKKILYAAKLKKATHALFFKHHRRPGVKGWELRKRLGADYAKILAMLNRHLEKLDLQVKTVFEEGPPSDTPTRAQLDKARYYITIRGGLALDESKMIGWRIDDIAGLAITISTIISNKGKAARDEVEKILGDKLTTWRVGPNIDRYVRAGYIDEDKEGQLYLDWRTKAEIEEKTLIDLLLSK